MITDERKVLWEYLDLRDVTRGDPLHPLVKEFRLIEVKYSRMENLTERGDSKLFSSRNIKNNVWAQEMGKACSTPDAVKNKISVFNPEGKRLLHLNGLELRGAAVNWRF